MSSKTRKRDNPSSSPDPKRAKVEDVSVQAPNAKFLGFHFNTYGWLLPSKAPQKEEGINSTNNKDKQNKAAHPQFGKNDPKPEPGSQRPSLDQQRAALQFPKTWDALDKKGKQPVILVPPTGLYGGSAYEHNITTLLLKWGHANPMWINVPGAMANWSWVNSEYVAYAIHYVYNITRQKKVTLIAWSQGNLACQWALTFWPSTQALVNNFISISADFRGTKIAYAAAAIRTTPSILNQKYNSHFITALRANGGDSAWVPHTSIFSSRLDEVVQPQAGENASAWINDNHKKGSAVNVDVAEYSGKQVWMHGTLIFHPLVWAIIKDCISHGGPTKLERLNPNIKALMNAPGAPIIDLEEADGVESLKVMVRFIPNLMNWVGMEKSEAELPAYARSAATHQALQMVSKMQLPPLSAQQKKMIADAEEHSEPEPSKHDPKIKVVIPQVLPPEWVYSAFIDQWKHGKDVRGELKRMGYIQ